MSQDVPFYYDYVSPFSYLAYSQRRVLEEAGANLLHRPIFLGGLNAAIGNIPPIQRPGSFRMQYILQDLSRWSRHYGLKMAMNPAFPMSTLHLLRGAALADAEGCLDAYSAAAFNAVWEEAKDVSQMPVARAVAESVGLDGDAFEAATTDPAVKATVKENTAAAIEAGVFGVPTFFVGESMYFGNDRLMFLLHKLNSLGAKG